MLGYLPNTLLTCLCSKWKPSLCNQSNFSYIIFHCINSWLEYNGNTLVTKERRKRIKMIHAVNMKKLCSQSNKVE